MTWMLLLLLLLAVDEAHLSIRGALLVVDGEAQVAVEVTQAAAVGVQEAVGRAPLPVNVT